MFRLIPFRSMKELNTSEDPETLYTRVCSTDSILIQDTRDMVIEEFTKEQLRSYEENNIWFKGFSFTGALPGDVIEFNHESYDVYGDKFLNDTVQVSIEDDVYYGWVFPELDFSDDSNADFSSEELVLTFGSLKFSLTIFNAFTSDRETNKTILLLNGIPYYYLHNMSFEDDVQFEVIQVCKTRRGFELVIYFDSTYIGISLDSDLHFLRFYNFINNFDCTKVPDDFKFKCARNKLLGEY